ncbi:MAG: TonB-dependent receptor [Paludibacteraceae bacterium]|nr:TonB-dependent receptor [Paludibacteraceae bacterium]
MRFTKSLISLLAMLFVSVSMFAQVTTANMVGIISDANETLPGAVVTLTYSSTGQTYYTTTDNNGVYHFNNVQAGGPYDVEVQTLGYRNLKVLGIYLNLADNNQLDLQVEQESFGVEEIVVTAQDLSSMASSRAGSITAISSAAINLLPTSNRSMNDVMSLTPQATVTSNGFAVGGGNYRQSAVTVDGAAFNNGFGIGSNLPAGGTPISLDALDQMSISITPYDVRQSGFVGGAIQTTTKSGSNEWKFSVYDYFKNDALQGKKYGDLVNGARPELKLAKMLKNTTGFTLGGPIIKNKLFFFLNAEYDVDNNPGQSYIASTDGTFGGQVKRPTEAKMNEISQYLQDKYGYNPGAYQGYSYNTPDWKILARLDYRINNNHSLNLRYSYTHNYYTTAPSTSVSPFGSSALYNRNQYGRGSQYALYFQSACYNQEQNFGSLAAEWNARFADGKGTNQLRVAWSHQYEPRSFAGELFPTVDILENIDTDNDGVAETRAVYTTFGMDPFTYGNLRDVQTVTVTDNVTYAAGLHTITAGAQFEYNSAINGYMQMGNSYFLYESWDAFKNQETPLAFAITHANRDDLKQQFPTIKTTKYSVYAQDEMDLHKQFKLTLGLRLELPIYPALDCENKAFTEVYKESTKWQTNQTPRPYLNISPRVGFNWDVLGNRKMIVRGGTGVFAGTLPMVWLVSAVGNSNTMQAQTLLWQGHGTDDATLEKFKNNFGTSIEKNLETLYGGTFQQKDLAAPTAPTILGKDLRLPTTWKSSLAVDFNLPEQWKLSFEGIFNKDLNSVMCYKAGYKEVENGWIGTEGVTFDARSKWEADGTKINPYVLTNSKINGYYGSFTAKVEKAWNCGVNLMAAYTYSKSMTINEGLGDQVTSVFSTNTFTRNGSNSIELGQSGFVSPHRVVATLSYRIPEKIGATTLALHYEGSSLGYEGTYSYTRWTPTMSTDVTGQGGAYNTIFIPTEDQLEIMNFSSETNKYQFNEWIESNKYLASHRGQFAERGCMAMPWHNQLDFKFMQNFFVADGSGRKHNLELGWDVNNVLNLLNPAWGTYKQISKTQALSWKDGVYTFDPTVGQFNHFANTASTWSMLLSLRYYF